MAQQVKELAAQPDNSSSKPRTHRVGGENTHSCVRAHTHTQSKCEKIKNK